MSLRAPRAATFNGLAIPSRAAIASAASRTSHVSPGPRARSGCQRSRAPRRRLHQQSTKPGGANPAPLPPGMARTAVINHVPATCAKRGGCFVHDGTQYSDNHKNLAMPNRGKRARSPPCIHLDQVTELCNTVVKGLRDHGLIRTPPNDPRVSLGRSVTVAR